MGKDFEARASSLAMYVIENNATVRMTAKKFGHSKSTVHKDLTERLPKFNKALFAQVRVVLDTNLSNRAVRGGLATKEKYSGTRRCMPVR